MYLPSGEKTGISAPARVTATSRSTASDAPPGEYSKATFAADLLALLDAEGRERQILENERQTAEKIAASWDHAVELSLGKTGVSA